MPTNREASRAAAEGVEEKYRRLSRHQRKRIREFVEYARLNTVGNTSLADHGGREEAFATWIVSLWAALESAELLVESQSSLLQEAREALEKIERHHVALNKKHDRPEGSSHTLAVVRLALAKLSASASVAASPTQEKGQE